MRKQLALYQESRVKPRRADDATRLILAGLVALPAGCRVAAMPTLGDLHHEYGLGRLAA